MDEEREVYECIGVAEKSQKNMKLTAACARNATKSK